MSQIPLTLILPRSDAVKDYFVSEANQLAYDWIVKWPDWPLPYRSINIFGPKGCGKSHLGKIYAANKTIISLTQLREFDRAALESADGYILDDLSPSSGFSEEAVFHFFNYLAETQKSALILSKEPVSQMPWQVPDLASRCRSLPCQEVYLPDDHLLAALLETYFAERQCSVSEAVLNYILARVERSYEAVAELAYEIDKISLAQKKPVTIALVRGIFESQQTSLNFEEETDR